MSPRLGRRGRVAWGAVVEGLQYQLRGHLPRTALACFGITVGAAGLVAVLSVGGGLRRLLISDARQAGGELSVIITPPGTERRAPLTLEDIDRIGRIPGVQAVVPETGAPGRVGAGGRQVPAQVQGVTPEFLSRRGWTLDWGRGIAPEDVYSSRRVCVLGHTVASRLFPDARGTDGAVSIDGLRFSVAGALEPTSPRDPGAGGVVLVPITTSLEALRIREVGRATVEAAHVEEVPAIVGRIRRWLAREHPSGEYFRVRSPAGDARGAVRALRGIEVSLGALAAICLGLGGLGILNVMLASLDERVYEIGLRAATGAPGHALLLQLLAESSAMNLAGFLPGIALGAGVSSCVEWSVSLFLPGADFRAAVTGEALLAAGLASGGIGLLSGVVPALRAARMSPVEALKGT